MFRHSSVTPRSVSSDQVVVLVLAGLASGLHEVSAVSLESGPLAPTSALAGSAVLLVTRPQLPSPLFVSPIKASLPGLK